MTTTRKVFRYQTRNVARSRALIGYALFFLAATVGLIRLGGGVERVLPSLANVMLLTVPLVSLLVATVFLYDGRPFTELLLSQPVGRPSLFAGMYLGLTLPLIGAFLVGVGGPLAAFGAAREALSQTLLLLLSGTLLTAVFSAIGFVVAFSLGEAARGLGVALLIWLSLTVVYDGIVLIASHALAAYPLERPMLLAMVLNPVDLARVLILIAVDSSALLGYTGAVFQDFFGHGWGLAGAALSLAAWIALPYTLALWRFRRMDF
jgi:Cu-processing system permease protein